MDQALIQPLVLALQILVPSLLILGLLGGLQIWGIQQACSGPQILVVKKQTLGDTVFNSHNVFVLLN